MIKTKRIQQIQEYVTKHQTASLDELVSVFHVSKNTIRRDIQFLVDQGEIKKVYGGVAVNEPLVSFSDRKTRNQSQKEQIAKIAANYMDDGDIIFVDSGTTTLELIEYIKKKNLTIITSNIDFIVRSLPYENLNIISIGGVLLRQTNSFVNYNKNDVLEGYNINKAFMASTGISILNGVTNASPLETRLKQAAVEKSSTVFLLIDQDKFDKQGLMTYCSLDDIDYIVTYSKPEEKYLKYAKENNVEIVTVNQSH